MVYFENTFTVIYGSPICVILFCGSSTTKRLKTTALRYPKVRWNCWPEYRSLKKSEWSRSVRKQWRVVARLTKARLPHLFKNRSTVERENDNINRLLIYGNKNTCVIVVVVFRLISCLVLFISMSATSNGIIKDRKGNWLLDQQATDLLRHLLFVVVAVAVVFWFLVLCYLNVNSHEYDNRK